MSFRIQNVKLYESPPGSRTVRDVLRTYGTTPSSVVRELKRLDFRRRNPKQGLQIELSKRLQDLLARSFQKKGLSVYTKGRQCRYSDAIDLRADLAVKRGEDRRGIYVEIEFRPNIYKDLVKFEIGHRSRLVELGVMVVAQNRNHINRRYTTMPEFSKCSEIIEALKPKCPILLIGIDSKA